MWYIRYKERKEADRYAAVDVVVYETIIAIWDKKKKSIFVIMHFYSFLLSPMDLEC